MIIPRIKVGELVFSDTAARYAADLLGDVAGTLVEIGGRLGDRAAERNLGDSASHALADLLVVDMPALLAGADYALWMRDHVLHELAVLCNADLHWAELYGDADRAELCRMQQEPRPPTPPRDPPASLVPLQQIVERCRCIPDEAHAPLAMGAGEPLVDVIAAGYAVRLEWIRENLAEARTALGRNTTGKTAALVAHVEALTRWLAPAS